MTRRASSIRSRIHSSRQRRPTPTPMRPPRRRPRSSITRRPTRTLVRIMNPPSSNTSSRNSPQHPTLLNRPNRRRTRRSSLLRRPIRSHMTSRSASHPPIFLRINQQSINISTRHTNSRMRTGPKSTSRNNHTRTTHRVPTQAPRIRASQLPITKRQRRMRHRRHKRRQGHSTHSLMRRIRPNTVNSSHIISHNNLLIRQSKLNRLLRRQRSQMSHQLPR